MAAGNYSWGIKPLLHTIGDGFIAVKVPTGGGGDSGEYLLLETGDYLLKESDSFKYQLSDTGNELLPPIALSFVAVGSNSSSSTMTLPTTAAGDILVLLDMAFNSFGSLTQTQSLFTNDTGLNIVKRYADTGATSNKGDYAVATVLCDTGISGKTINCFDDGSQVNRWYQFRGNRPIASFVYNGSNDSGLVDNAAESPDTLDVSSGTDTGLPVLAFVHSCSYNGEPGWSASVTLDHQGIAGGTEVETGYKIFSATDAKSDFTVTDTAFNGDDMYLGGFVLTDLDTGV